MASMYFNSPWPLCRATYKSCLQYASTDAEKVNYFILHQANKLINDSIRKKLQMDATKFPSSLEEFGNTSSATIPLTMIHCLRQRTLYAGACNFA
jgi:3-oxoacyl-[acyl-carrier-protein] synthase III